MGVPKFFRYISERYPCLSDLVREYQLPEFDNLYLDMNGIIHVCSHPNDTDPHFRITEEKIFRDIFHYIESLFRMIQPQKLFFMAVDGVAPRAKMNQQRGRRFRSAKEAENAEKEAQIRGETLPSEERFDSNCITPGTEFMTRLHAQLKYFVTYKISTDRLWQKVKVILSGHETPGEGEHKIMDYIRYMKSQPGYDPHTRHCLYGLDADLIMLGLCSHEPHFSLLREEVKYGSKNNQKRIPTPEETTFYLLHLSLMREYLDLEFQELKDTLTTFPYDLEHIIDDWVLMGFLVGNDFIPHLPELHINKGALPILYRAYMDVLPTLDGYINEGGTLHLGRFEKYMQKLAAFDFEQFKEISADLRYFEAKTGRKQGAQERHSYKNIEATLVPPKDKALAALIASTKQLLESSEEEEDDEDENYTDIDTDEEDEDGTSMAEFCAHKKNYYMEKLEYKNVTPQVLKSQSEGYVRAIQWNLNYYYNGCCSWSWFYPHHYAPYISDIKDFSNLVLDYDLGKPFLPFQQLLAVLPAASKKLLPEAYHDLMINEESPIFQYYPTEFRTDLNGKKQEWEAVVLIPFIEQECLVKAMDTKEVFLTEEEKSRNKHGPMHIFSYSADSLGSYLAPAYFPALANHHASMEDVDREQIHVEPSCLVKGLCPGIDLSIYCPGFPTLRHMPFTAQLKSNKVKVFDHPSQGDNMILTLLLQEHPEVSEVAAELLGKTVFVNWPHLLEAKVIGISNPKKRFKLSPEDGSVMSDYMNHALQQQWDLVKSGIEEKYLHRLGVDIGETEALVYCCVLQDAKYVLVDDKLHFQKQWSLNATPYAFQTVRSEVIIRQEPIPQDMTVELLYPPGAVVFSLDPNHYGSMGTVVQSAKVHVNVGIEVQSEPNPEEAKNKLLRCGTQYYTGNAMAQRLGITPLLLSRMTGTVFLLTGNDGKSDQARKLNIGLNLKFNKRNEEVAGYSRKDKFTGYWFYSDKAGQELEEYRKKFPMVFNYLVNNNGQDVTVQDIFPEETEQHLSHLKQWLKERESTTAERLVCGAQIVDEDVVLAVEKYIDDFFETETTRKPITLNLKPSQLYLPKTRIGQAPDPKAVHQLFDRIVNVRESHTVPLGAKGTIIGIHNSDDALNTMYDILFDKGFTGGLKLRCSPNRGYRLPVQAFINISAGHPSVSHRTPAKPTAIVEPSPGGKDETRTWNKGGRNSAFAWCRNRPASTEHSPTYQTTSPRGNLYTDQTPRAVEARGRNKHDSPSYPGTQSTPQQLSNEFLTMINNLQRESANSKGQFSKSSRLSMEDSSQALKKVLKIADDGTKRQPSNSENRSPMKITNSNTTNYSMQLLSLHQKLGKTPKYLYNDLKDGSIVSTVICYNGREYQGAPSFTSDSATESAARNALQSFALDDSPAPQLHRRQQRNPSFDNRKVMTAPRDNWREPAQPALLPTPPTNWYQNQQVHSFLPEWMGSGYMRPHQPNFYSPPSQFQMGGHRPLPPPQAFHSPHPAPQFNSQVIPGRQQKQIVPRQTEYRFQNQPQKSSTSVTSKDGSQTMQNKAPSISQGVSRPPRSRIAANFSVKLNDRKK